MNIAGSIPKKIVYFYLPEKKMLQGVNWGLDYKSRKNKNEELVCQASVADPNDAKSLKVAQSLLKGYARPTPTSIEVDNNPIKDIRLFSIKRYGSSTQIKVVINNYLVDLKDDVLLDALIKEGCKVGGVLPGEYVWAKIGSSTRLVRIDSEIYNLILDYNNKKNMPLIPKKKLEAGGVYKNKRGDVFVFVGFVNTTWYKPFATIKKFNFTNQNIKNGMLFCNLLANEEPSCLNETAYLEADNYRFVVKKEHNLIEKIDQVEIEPDLINKIRLANLKKMKKNIMQFSTENKKSVINTNYLEYILMSRSRLINLYKVGDSPVELFDVKKYLAFS